MGDITKFDILTTAAGIGICLTLIQLVVGLMNLIHMTGSGLVINDGQQVQAQLS
jgi:hypothetical protein